VRRVAAAAWKTDSATVAAAKLRFNADTAWVTIGGKVSWETVRVERRKGEWIARPGIIMGIR